MTHTHLYLMEPALAPAGETRSVHWLMKALAERLGLEGFHPWASEEAMVDAILDHPCTGHATVASLRTQGGIAALNISHVANPDLDFDTPSRKIEFYSARAQSLGLPPLPSIDAPAPAASAYPLTLTQGRTLTHFHAFYNNGRELPPLARREGGAQLWIATADAAERGVADGAPIRIFNERGGYVRGDFDWFLKAYDAACTVLQRPEDFRRLTLAVCLAARWASLPAAESPLPS